LRERGDDVGLLAEYFLRHFISGMNKPVKGISLVARKKLATHHWPGNVRELKNVIERALILEHTPEIQAASLPDFQIETQLHKTAVPLPAGNESLDEIVGQFERELIGGLLEKNGFNLNKTAEQFKISRHALRYRIQRLNIPLAEDAEERAAAGKEAS
jgi:transcriptional regulator with PAS, ATPase and Fis domain